jgi:hypothetical protein
MGLCLVRSADSMSLIRGGGSALIEIGSGIGVAIRHA